MSATIYVLDTSYLIEVAGGGRDSHPVASAEVRRRLRIASSKGGRFFVPLPCLFELGDHIADVKHEQRRSELVSWLCSTVTKCLQDARPWTITPTQRPQEVLPSLMSRFRELANRESVGLVDAFTEAEAKRLKADFAGLKCRVHIWTNDEPLKRLEPDKEVNPYLWR